MPFTFSHPAIVLPLSRLPINRISSTGLVIGSMAPDFEYFINMRMQREHGHSWGGLFYYDLPVTIISAFLFHLLVRDKLINSLPELLRIRFSKYTGNNWLAWVKKYWYVLIYSSLIGIFSHIFWDAFTHEHGYFVRRIPFLQQQSRIFMADIPNYHLNQIFSSLFGGFFISLVILLPLNKKLNFHILWPKLSYWTIVIIIQVAIIFVRGIESFGDFVATSISGFFIGMMLAPTLIHFISKKIWKTENSQ